jgi:hypothetical protein
VTQRYFAYGSNMNVDKFHERVPSAKRIGQVRLDGYRLAFSRRSIRTESGVANIVADSGFSTWGVLFEIEDRDMQQLELKEGLHLKPPAYQRIDVVVRHQAAKADYEAFAFVVVDAGAEEYVPEPDYLRAMIEAMEDGGQHSPTPYRQFLTWLEEICGEKQAGTLLTRPGLLVTATSDRRGSNGVPIIRLPDSAPTASREAVCVTHGRLSALAKSLIDRRVAADRCEMDQTLRFSLGMSGQLVYGQSVEVSAAPRRAIPQRALSARTLTLKLSQARRGDAEKGICIMHERNLLLLGLQPGDFIDIHRVSPVEGSEATVQQITRRAFPAGDNAGSAPSGTYPDLDRIYIDAQDRSALGIDTPASEYLGSPLLVRPSVKKAIQARSVAYGLTMLLGVTTLSQILQLFDPHLSSVVTIIVALTMAAALTGLIATFDVRSKISV